MRKRTKFTMFALLALLLAGYVVGYLSHSRKLPPYGYMTAAREWWAARGSEEGEEPQLGKFHRDRRGQRDLTTETQERLAALGYLSGYEPATESNGVVVHVPELAFEGLNLYTSGHAPEAFLIDMDGNVLHRWSYEFADAFPGKPIPEENSPHRWWRRVHLLEDGGLLAIYEGRGLIRLDRDSTLIWAEPGGYHHEVWVDSDGTIYALYREDRMIERINETTPILEDFVVILDPQGKEQRRVSLLQIFERSSYASLLLKMPKHGDVFHTNALDILDGSHPAKAIFGKGLALISMRSIHTIAVVDLDREEVVWALAGMWAHQHDPTLLPNGNLLLFDNTGHFGRSKVVEFDPLTHEMAWAYLGDEANGFFSATLGTGQRLPNGNTLITESEAGRAFEVTADLQIVWEFYNPQRAGQEGEFIATLFEMLRLPPELDTSWIPSATAGLR